MTIPVETYAGIVRLLPILCVDVVIKNELDEFLLIRRANEPMLDEWWVPGGRVLHSETAVQAVRRKIHEELGAEAAWIEHSGYFERTFPVNPFGDAAAYHTVSLVFESGLVDIESIVLDSQSTAYKWAAALPHQFLIQN